MAAPTLSAPDASMLPAAPRFAPRSVFMAVCDNPGMLLNGF
jgi:hypothetical protein